jgi:hypothetical protein
MALPRIARPLAHLAGAAALAFSALTFAGQAVASAAVRPGPDVATSSVLYLQNGVAKVKTSNGDSWYLLVDWIGDAGPTTADLEVGLERLVTSPSGVEVHSWSFAVKQTSLVFNDKTGTLDTSSQTSPVLSTLDLAFKTTSSKKATCAFGSETVYTGTLSGKVNLVTGLSGGGTVSGSLAFNVTPPEILVDSGCVPPPADPCVPEIVAGSGTVTGTATELFAASLREGTLDTNFVGLSKITKLSAPSGASRTDIAAMEDQAGKVYATYTGSSVKIASTGLLTGSGVVSGGKPKTATETCTYKSIKYDETVHYDTPANYSGKFSAKMAIGSPLTGPTSTKTGAYDVITVKTA